ncbi:uncharacterized protein CANTADRAFT_53499 [Suhomyces tanzawaensis NRRL Y-17324]|uniref:RRM domain-containing protein n=1 Tax=Suhomyces tanzawaensis NRRL Y-17324 TaxID=984487 RepID=A0A1E4SGH4_9ASCO|nr:uncharacterized protein CANTADRAFT_53499 [Suhomyces tanzawaensis NRRL Y-17324]ODV78570.1 hypothetical protein CANTADRAFT_53499 [Suhomyces tanzawaensis NRRL Y-17324]
MSTLDKSLDEIISSTKKTRKVAPKAGKANKVGKKIGSLNKKPIVSFKKSPAVVAATKAATLDLSAANKVVVYNLPRDLKQDNIKDFFQSQVGGVQTISLNYNEKGQFKGIATIIFKTNKSASLAVEKYNGAPIDGGSSKLKLELIIDPSKKTLASRITANPTVNPKVAAAKKQLKAIKAVKAKQGVKPAAKPAAKKKPVKKTKKTVEELDQEMADYFDN